MTGTNKNGDGSGQINVRIGGKLEIPPSSTFLSSGKLKNNEILTINWAFIRDSIDPTRTLTADLTMYRKVTEKISIFNSIKTITNKKDVVVLGRELYQKSMKYKFTGQKPGLYELSVVI